MVAIRNPSRATRNDSGRGCRCTWRTEEGVAGGRRPSAAGVDAAGEARAVQETNRAETNGAEKEGVGKDGVETTVWRRTAWRWMT